MKGSKWVVALALIAAITMPTVAQVQNKAFKGSPQDTYYMVTFVSGVEYWVAAFEGFKDCAKQLGVKAVYSGTPEYDLNKQMTVFDQVVSKRPAGIALSPIDQAGCAEGVKAAMGKGIPVVTFASDTDAPKVAFVTSDNVKEGQAAARAVGKELGGKGKVMVTRNSQSNHQKRVDVFVETIKNEFPGILIVADILTQQDTNKAYTSVLTVLQKHPDLGAVFCPEGPSGRGAAQAAVEKGGKVKVLCCDMDAAILDMLEKGQLYGSIQPNAYVQGYLCMLNLFLAHDKMLDPLNASTSTPGAFVLNLPVVDNGLDIIGKDTAKYFYTDKWLQKRGAKAFQPWK